GGAAEPASGSPIGAGRAQADLLRRSEPLGGVGGRQPPDFSEDRLLPATELPDLPVWRDGHVVYATSDTAGPRVVVRVDGRVDAVFDGRSTVVVGRGGAWWTEPANDGREWSVLWGPTHERISLGAAPDSRIVASPDGRRYAIRAPGDPRRLLVDGAVAARGAQLSDPVWSPDGRHLLVASF